MFRTRFFIASSSLLLVFFAGCADTAANDAARLDLAADRAAFDATTGSVRGLVLTEDQLPIEGAQVTLVQDPDAGPGIGALTTVEGVFFLNFVPPGTHRVMAGKDGYEVAIKQVDVRVGKVTEEIVFQLSRVASDAPYHTTTIHPVLISGLSFTVPKDCIYFTASLKTCQGSRSQCDGDANLPDPCEVHYGHCGVEEGAWGYEWSNFGCDFGPEWETIIMELSSIPQTTTTGKGWSITALGPHAIRAGCNGNATDCGAAQNDGNPSAFRTVSTAPIYQWIDKEILAERGVKEDGWCCDWVWRLFPGPCDVQGCDFPVGNVGIMQEQKATVYWTYFMRAPAPAGWSAVEDV